MIEVGILKNFDSGTYKAGVQLAGSLTTYFDDISVAKNIPSSALVIGNYVILAIPGGNPRDACVIATWPGGTPGGGMEVHDNEYHDPDFEEEGVAASLVETHRTSETHTQPQPPVEHGNEKHDPDFASEAALANHEAASAAGVHGSTSAATANKLVHRDASGRAKVAAPSTSDDIARKQEVDAKPSTFLQLPDTPSSYSGQAGKVPKINTAENALEFSDLAPHASRHQFLGDDLLDISKLIIYRPWSYTDWQTRDNWTDYTTGSGSVTWLGILAMRPATGATSGSIGALYCGTSVSMSPVSSGRLYACHIALRSTVADSEVWAAARRTEEAPNSFPSLTERHVGFRILNGRLYASNGNGTNGTQTDTGIDFARYGPKVLVALGGSGEVKFYCNSVLVATHTTNLPAAYGYRAWYGTKNSVAADKIIEIKWSAFSG